MINENVPAIEVAVQIEGVDAREYNVPDDAQSEIQLCKVSTKYIECIDDAFFAVRMRASSNYDWHTTPHILSFDIFVDGQLISSKTLRERKTSSLCKGHHELDETTGQAMLRKLRFAPVKTVEDAKRERIDDDLKLAKHLGVIEVVATRGTSVPKPYSSGRVIENRNLELAEKSLKGKAVYHGTTFEFSEPAERPRGIKFTRLRQDKGPIATFRFLYRSRDALKNEMIIPRSPTPPPPPSPFDALTEADIHRLARERFEQLKGGDVKEEKFRLVKRDQEEVYDLTSEGASKRRKGNMPKLEREQSIEVVDLSDDDD